ncbi:unnamed protein product [Penicillium nalgiovense]|uniref:RING-type domain-containing protein n=1 Tax=Penicillium nalgiovense TaxID=60175 RepID=A0A9W4HLE0_PENNA|nr:unnamed protein product [Penicillium nalgiovense]CAG7995965.1 unnamed protein product [Penicillium nalgiovense]CAG8043962.1 unnamed protein product [Penicillium nalgiovense]CAG8050365.1 unnamed protein product [Penicillium nalgiovense]CAG8051968.1 unnamed protein product [Penicillium nalgiovense]
MEDAVEPLSLTHPTDADCIPTVMNSSKVSSSDVSSSEEHTPSDTAELPHLVIQLIQCQQCSRPLRSPLRLPCGNSVCRECLPALRPRTGITYPVAEGRDQEFTCFWKGNKACVGDHCVGDCGADVLLGKLVGLFGEILGSEANKANNVPRDWSEDDGPFLRWKTDGRNRNGSAQLRRHGWLGGIYSLTLDGRFPSDACEVTYEGSTTPAGSIDSQDLIHFQTLHDRLRAELDCQVCYSLVLDPMTTPCGHTFCRKCVARVLDHTDLCPICRRKLGMPNDLQSEPVNQTVTRLVDYLFPDQISLRRETSAQDETSPDYEKNLPLFVCTLSFPTMPTFLHVFEPRYRLMIRRVLASGNGKFGIVMYNRQRRAPPGQREDVPFVQYGTLLMIERYELLPDGRSLVVATGVSRFRILDSGMRDGYFVARTERIDDISLAEEERLESMETSTDGVNALPEENESDPPLDSMSTQQLLLLAREFISNQRRSGAPWLHPRVMLAYGPIPTDAALFPWWFASILPISEEEKYPILAATSVRERLKISAKWARQLEARDWSTRSSLYSVL